MSNILIEKYGQEIDLGVCLIGKNLNIFTLRGFTNIELLADISGGDVYDEVKNPEGTQRDLKTKHSKEALEYALDSLNEIPSENPRAFPELTLNIRDSSVIRVFDLNNSEINFESTDFISENETISVRVKILTSAMNFPIPQFNPQISRVDGNHRLSQAENLDHDLYPEIPNVPFSIFVGLSTMQERKLFSDINGKHVGMPPAIVTSFEGSFIPADVALTSSKGRAVWLAKQLTGDNMAFYGQVHFGGSTDGAKEVYGAIPPITIQGLRNGILKTLASCPSLESYLFPAVDLQDPTQNSDQKKKERIDRGYVMLDVLNRYWTAVRYAFPDAW